MAVNIRNEKGAGMESKFMTYKGYPLVRKGDEIYFGYMSDDYVVWMQIDKKQTEEGVDVSQKIRLYQMSTDEKLSPIEAITKTSERDTLYDALDVAVAWLERANSK